MNTPGIQCKLMCLVFIFLLTLTGVSGGYSDEFHYGIETGITFNKFIPIVRLYAVKSFQNREPNFNSEGTSLYSNNREYLVLAPKLSYKISNKVEQLHLQDLPCGKLIFANPAYKLGVFYSYKS